MTFIKEKLKEKRVPAGVLNSNALKYIEEVISEEQDIIDKEAMSELRRIADVFENATREAESIQEKYDEILRKAKEDAYFAQNEMRQMLLEFKKAKEQEGQCILDKDLAESVKAYRSILEATKEVFGDGCTEGVIKKAIKAGSYVAWRGIMGPKHDENKYKRI